MRRISLSSETGVILPMVIILAVALTITGLAFLQTGVMENSLVRKEIGKNQAFYLAEAGLERLAVKLYAGEHQSIKDQDAISGGEDGAYRPVVGRHDEQIALGEGHYWVEYYFRDPPELPYAISIGRIMENGHQILKKIKVDLPFLAEPYEHSIYAASRYSPDWTLELRGMGDPYRDGDFEYGGKDVTEGDIYADADIHLYQETSVYPPPDPNTYELLGEVSSTDNVFKHPNPGFAGFVPYTNENVEPIDIPDLTGMNYAENNTHDLGAIFDFEGVFSGHLPDDHELYDVVMKNPSDRSSECSSTTGDDYFFEPATISGAGTVYTGETPLNLGADRIYYVDGDVWFHNTHTYGFEVSGKTLIVATGDIHISDNIEYADPNSDLLAVVALGDYDLEGNLISGGNIYFGDPVFGTTYTVSAFMFAGNNFLYNVSSTDPDEYERPETGFNVFGNWVAINEVSVIRDWYETGHWETGTRWVPGYWDWENWTWVPGYWEDYEEWVSDGWNPAYFDLESGAWRDLQDDLPLSEEEFDQLRHYQMKVTYDERICDPETQPPGLPQGYGTGSIFSGFTHWEEIA